MSRFSTLLAVLVSAIGLTCPAGAAGLELGIAGGAQFLGDISELDVDTDEGFSLGLELMFDIPIVKLGLGYEYGFPRSTELLVDDLEYHLVYAMARLHVLGPAYLAARVGYANLSADVVEISVSEDGFSWSAGLGIKLWRFNVEALYNQFDITVSEVDATIDYRNYALRAIFTF
jgi:hypothetical protein